MARRFFYSILTYSGVVVVEERATMSEQPEIPHYGAPDQAPELPARTESLGLAEYLVKKLEDMDTRLQISNANLERNLPGAIAHIMRDELKGASIPVRMLSRADS